MVKTMIHLAMARLPFGVEIVGDPSGAPKGKLPYIRDSDMTIADSELIRKHLEQRYGVDFDHGLAAAEKADALAFTRLAEDHLYWCAMYDYWQVDERWTDMKPVLFAGLSPDQVEVIADRVRDRICRDLQAHGIGRHSPDEVLIFVDRDIQALSDRLGDRHYWFGDSPTSADAAIAPQIQTIVGDPTNGPISRLLKARSSLVDYATRVLEALLPDRLG